MTDGQHVQTHLLGREDGDARSIDAVVVGAGFAGVYALYRLRKLGFTVQVFEAGSDIGGTWFHNRYPGARCDIESLDYSYSFDDDLQQEWHWTERYASQPELLRYINHVAERHDLRRDIRTDSRVTSATWDEDAARWLVRTDDGDAVSARFCVLATGVLSVAQVPQIDGLDTFQGEWFHTGDWPNEGVDVSGKRVAVIGTGSSGTQLIPIVAEQAAHLTVFQRTPNFCMPAQNHDMIDEVEREWKAEYPQRRAFARESGFGHNQLSNPKKAKEVSAEERRAEFELRWQLGGLYMMRAFSDILVDPVANEECAEFVRGKIRETVQDPEVAEKLSPRGFYFGTKRLCSGTGYYETFNRENVTLVDVRTAPIERITPTGLATTEAEYDVDVIVFATGFDAMTGSMLKIDIQGAGGEFLREKWAHGPRSYLGVAPAGFPNLFIVAGPGSPSVFSNMVNSIEQHVEWIAALLEQVTLRGLQRVEATPEAEQQWIEHVNEVAERTLYPRSPNSWFFGANTPGKPRVFMPYVGGVGTYRQKADDVAAKDYEGFVLR
ncbi:NAD(P)/FAD-dependent oxidoreductase [Blastococcus sp. CT_GayMR16]|uniref:flavin-containing monooxygenase n=1 Tax=Blastococcus sp. CT_GayMR16 TaxID=2559607 RepID=UPI0010737795|nr:NAD(P)/FAD-dependent oxidoreductase [Blastococcus sp. CT_GayMR16]TFV87230.1 NAD(P)/FAD-dependent oxidoreductase [Blastococcus sp. CT_GayMR16]